MREFTDLKWGTPQPISLRDSELGFARVRGFGQYTIQIAEPKRFVDQIVGTQGLYRTSQIEDYLRNTIISSLTDVLGENMKSIFDLPALTDELSAAIRAKAAPAFEAMGIKLKQLMVVSLTPTEETARAIDERASMQSDRTRPVTASAEGCSPYGVCDLVGNVREWTTTRWGEETRRATFTYPYRPDEREAPGERANELRICRGGAYDDPLALLRCSARTIVHSDARLPTVGFRVACDP